MSFFHDRFSFYNYISAKNNKHHIKKVTLNLVMESMEIEAEEPVGKQVRIWEDNKQSLQFFTAGGCWRVCHGEEDSQQTDDGDPHTAGGVRVHQDSDIPWERHNQCQSSPLPSLPYSLRCLQEPVERWPICDCLIAFHSKGFPLEKAIDYANLRKPMVINDLVSQYEIMVRTEVYRILEREGIELPRYAVLDRSLPPDMIQFEEQDDRCVLWQQGNQIFNILFYVNSSLMHLRCKEKFMQHRR